MFTENGDIDESGTYRHVEYLLRCGVNGIVACGTPGEFIAMTVEERLRVISIIHDAVGGRVPLYAGTRHYSTRLTTEMTHASQNIGVDRIFCPSCSQKWTLLFSEYMNDRLLLALPHRQFVFTIPSS